MLLGLQCCLLGTHKGEVRYSLSQNNAPVSTSSTSWINLSSVIGPMPGENLECFLQLFDRREPLLGCEGAGEEVGEVALDEGEDQHVPHRRDWDDEDDREGDQHQDVLGRAPQRLHLHKTGGQMTSASG
jgi:hypothetical protein